MRIVRSGRCGVCHGLRITARRASPSPEQCFHSVSVEPSQTDSKLSEVIARGPYRQLPGAPQCVRGLSFEIRRLLLHDAPPRLSRRVVENAPFVSMIRTNAFYSRIHRICVAGNSVQSERDTQTRVSLAGSTISTLMVAHLAHHAWGGTGFGQGVERESVVLRS